MHTFLTHRVCNRCTGSGSLVRAQSGEPRRPGDQSGEPAGQEEPEDEVECPNHEPALFVKGKPRSILSLPL